MDLIVIKRVAATGDTTLLPQVWHARKFWQRLRGLLGKPALSVTQGLLIEPCRSIHTLGMKTSLDIVFMDKSGFVVKICQAVKPFRHAFSGQSHCTLELAPGAVKILGLSVGDQLTW